MNILHLTLKKKWFDLIASGEKKFEYRQDKPYWRTRLLKDGKVKEFDIVRFRNGYGINAPMIDVVFLGLSFTNSKTWKPKHGEEFEGDIIGIALGEVCGVFDTSDLFDIEKIPDERFNDLPISPIGVRHAEITVSFGAGKLERFFAKPKFTLEKILRKFTYFLKSLKRKK